MRNVYQGAGGGRLKLSAVIAVAQREWNTPVREPWNGLIKQALNAVDRHNVLYFDSRDPWHLSQAQVLRAYVADLKVWIHQQEAEECKNQK